MSKRGRPRKIKKRITLPGREGQAEPVAAEVDDPYEPGKKIRVQRNMLASPLTMIYGRGRLHDAQAGETADDGLVRLMAGLRFRGLCERADMSTARAIDYSAVKVDQSFVYRGMPDGQAAAFRELAQIAAAIGESKYYIARRIIGEEVPFMRVAQEIAGREPSADDRLSAYADLRDALDRLIEFWGVARGADRARM